jgi:hypothetical protein
MAVLAPMPGIKESRREQRVYQQRLQQIEERCGSAAAELRHILAIIPVHMIETIN